MALSRPNRTAARRRLFGSVGGHTWADPGRICQYVLLFVIYMAGLLAFQKYTGLLDMGPPAPSVLEDEGGGLRVKKSPDLRPPAPSPLLGAKTSPDLRPAGPSPLFRHLLSAEAEGDDLNNAGQSTNNSAGAGTNATSSPDDDDEPEAFFPPDIMSLKAMRHGGVAIYIIGLIYMFVALAIVCDEFFVPSLDVIIDVIGCSEDVAGATFMAAGGSAPELFTSVIGVFIAFSDVGIGTIVGSAVFNILFVIGMCALFSKTVLYLTWWPLFRDCTFYSISLVTLIVFFRDETIDWWESLTLLGIYFSYVAFMKFNVQAERLVKKLLHKNKVTRVRSTDHLVPSHHSAAAALAGVTGAAMSGVVAGEAGQRSHTSIPVLHAGSHFRHGLLQLMIHTIDPLHEGKVDEKATQLHAIASLKVLFDATKPQDGTNGNASGGVASGINPDGSMVKGDLGQDSGRASQGTEEEGAGANAAAAGVTVITPGGGDEEEENQPLDLSWPETARERITYILFLPIIIPLWITLPDTRKPSARKFFPITFLGSIMWIAVFSYLMVWWATVTGNVFGIPPEVMGLTFLAAGTSIPDLITSVIVARKGFGDMAVSSSVGSNIFDVTVGLPLPWFLYWLVFSKPVPVSARGMVCSISILFFMLLLVFFSILLFNWKMTKGMGFSMFIFYFAFVFVSLGFEYEFYECPKI